MDRLYCVVHQGIPRHVVERDGTSRLVEGTIFGDYSLGPEIAVNPAELLPPVQPSKIVAVGLNYRDHAAEQNKPLPAEPMIFMKPSTSVVGPGAPILLPPVGRVDHEAELGVVIGKKALRVAPDLAREYILGITCVNDVTARELQKRDVQYTRAKGFDTFAPVGPCVALGLDPHALDIEGWVNDQRRQASNTRELIFPVEHLISFISAVMTLLPGDIISTGTPAGVGPLADGDRVTIKVQDVGELTNPVAALTDLRV